MRNTILILAAASSLAGCNTMMAPHLQQSDAARGVESVNVPVVTRQDYAFDAAATDGYLTPASAARLDGWFQGLALGYGDSVYVEGNMAELTRRDVARVAGRYGMLVTEGGPVLAGEIAPGTVRVVVSRTRATVPNCPNWSSAAGPDLNGRTQSNFGCGVNTNFAMMVANPQDLVHGREGNGVGDTQTSTKAVESYRSQKPTGEKGLKDISTKGN